MAKNLVIVESPTKAKTLERYLGPEFTVKASVGHIRDLPQSGLGVDTERNFEPQFVVPDEKKKVVTALKSAYKKSAGLYLATDFDREGEAIAYHVADLLGVDPGDAKRVTFTEITEGAVREAFASPRAIDLALVEAQQARRILDRLVGYTLSPLLMRKVRAGLSAGRVQSPALRMIVEREREIEAFEAIEYWSVDARVTPGGDDASFLARLLQVDEEKMAASPDKKGLVLDEDAARSHAANLERAAYRVASVERSERKRRPSPPFTTSTLQQEASRKLGFSARKAMRVAQQLYEGVTLPGEGQVGLITYMRTDSTNLAEQFLKDAAEVVRQQFGDRYALPKPRRYRTKTRGAQEAHEAIRPTRASRLPDGVEGHLTRDQARLYRLVWQRAMASQMAEAILDQLRVDIEATAEDAPRYLLRATGQTVKFDGFRRVYFEGRDDAVDEDAESRLPADLSPDQALRLLEVLPEQHFTQPPPRYTEASLVKELEARGIGRPSTYATIVSNLIDRDYVRLEERRFFANDVGMVVIERVLVPNFPDIVDYEFTARMEAELDDVAEGKRRWTQVVDELWAPLERQVEKADQEIERSDVTSEPIGETCPKCGQGNLVKKLGRAGMFISCDRYPECDYSRDLEGERAEPEETDEKCPECGAPMLVRRSRFGPFLGCSRYPECKGKRSLDRSTGVTCPECGQGELVVKRTRRGRTFYGCNRYPECEFAVWQRPVKDPCPRCGSLLVATAKGTKCTACDYVSEGGGPTEAA
jgi:DNA topoisomerase I